MNFKSENKIFSSIPTIFSLSLTPFFILISTANSLFLKNQVELEFDLTVYLPFLFAFLLIVALATILFNLLKNLNFIFSFVFWNYYFAGIAFILFSTQIKHNFFSLGNKLPLLIITAVIVCLSFFLSHAKYKPFRGIKFFSSLFVLILVSELFIFGMNFDFTKLGKKQYKGIKPQIPILKPKSHPATKPNVYHIVLDAFQTDVLFDILNSNKDLSKKLGGFVFYPKNTALFHFTNMSIPTTFYGKNYDYLISQVDFRKKAAQEGLLHSLRNYNYLTYGFQTSIYIGDNFDYSAILLDYRYKDIKYKRSRMKTFIVLWTNSLFARKKLALATELKVIKSLHAFKDYMSVEPNLCDNNRYTYLHLMLPHGPFILNYDCSLNLDKISKIKNVYNKQMRPQAFCAMKLFLEFKNLLIKLGRYKDSLIIVHGDHGNFSKSIVRNKYIKHQDDKKLSNTTEKLTDRDLNSLRGRSRALLLVKPVGRSNADEFLVSEYPATLLDITPTILHSIGIPVEASIEGYSLLKGSFPKRNARYFHSKRSTSDNSWTDHYVRFTIEEGMFTFDKVIKLKNNPRPNKKKK